MEKVPAHIGVIMDGNGRWASLRGLPRVEGHRRGAERARGIIEASMDAGIRVLTLYTFSMENWQRPQKEVSTLMKLLEAYLKREYRKIVRDGLRFLSIGETWRLPENIRKLLADLTAETASNTGMTLVGALSYGGRNEIVRAVKKAISNGMSPEDVTEESFSGLLDTAGLPDPDLIIRTSGENRLSNFLPWQAAYAEFYFTETLWPDFSREEFMIALSEYGGRDRRFGAVSKSRG